MIGSTAGRSWIQWILVGDIYYHFTLFLQSDSILQEHHEGKMLWARKANFTVDAHWLTGNRGREKDWNQVIRNGLTAAKYRGLGTRQEPN